MRDFNDGYTWSAVLQTPEGKEFRFRYRPITKAEFKHAYDQAFVHRGPQSSQGMARHEGSLWLASHIVSSNEQYEEAAIIEELWERHPVLFRKLVRILMGKQGPQPAGTDWEDWSADNLRTGTRLFLTNQKIANRNCSDCKKWWYDEDTGEVTRINGLPILRPQGTQTLCETEDGCAKGTPENSRAWHEINKLAFRHWVGCKAINAFPDDLIVKRNAAIIQSVYREINDERRRSDQRSLGRGSTAGTVVGRPAIADARSPAARTANVPRTASRGATASR